jgi:hypothetical protein
VTGVGQGKHQQPSTKLQINIKHQAPICAGWVEALSFNQPFVWRDLMFESWRFSGAWILEFGASRRAQ